MSRRWPKGTLNPGRCRHRWQPVLLETPGVYFRDDGTHYETDSPHLERARVYLVCIRCASHTYMETAFAGVRLEGSQDRSAGKWEHHEERDRIRKLQAEDHEQHRTNPKDTP